MRRTATIAALTLAHLGWPARHAEAAAAPTESSDDGDDDVPPDDVVGDDPEPETDQPAVTAGGLYTIKTYPVSEIARPLTMTEHITQLRLSLGTDLSAKGAFKSLGASLEGIYGWSDNFSLIGGFTSAYNANQFGFYAGFEGALIYDLLDIRLAANLHRTAIPGYANFCSPSGTGDNPNAMTPTCASPGAMIVNLPDGTYAAGGTKVSVDVGFPFRYAIKPQIAIVALQTLISIDFNAVAGNRIIPDLEPSLGIAINPIPQVSLVAFAQLLIPDFDPTAGALHVPVTGRVQVTPTEQLDVGLEFTLLNVAPPDGQGPLDNRFLSLFVQARL